MLITKTIDTLILTEKAGHCDNVFCSTWSLLDVVKHTREALNKCTSSPCPASYPPKWPLGSFFNYWSQQKSNLPTLFLSSCLWVFHKLITPSEACNFWQKMPGAGQIQQGISFMRAMGISCKFRRFTPHPLIHLQTPQIYWPTTALHFTVKIQRRSGIVGPNLWNSLNLNIRSATSDDIRSKVYNIFFSFLIKTRLATHWCCVSCCVFMIIYILRLFVSVKH